MFKTITHPNTKELSSMKVNGGSAKTLVEISSLGEFQDFVAAIKDEEIMVVGEGTNTVFINLNPNLVLVKLNLKEVTLYPDLSPEEKGNSALKALSSGEGWERVEVSAGVNWDEFVQKYISLGGISMESLSAIPGTVGAAPVQNIGAYGQEVANFIYSVKVYDLKEKQFKTLNNKECEFTYRGSIFKEQKNRFIILSVVFEIKKGESKIPEYKDVKEYFETSNIKNPNILEIRNSIIEIRKFKLPDPKIINNCGSFFKNPTISQEELKKVKEFFPEIPIYKTSDPHLIKIPAGYILQRLGYKNFNPNFAKGNFGFYKNHSLILTSSGKGDTVELLEFIKTIKQKVFEVCGINLEGEVNLV